MRCITGWLFAACLAAPAIAAELGALTFDRSASARDPAARTVLLPGPYLLSPAGTNWPDHHWKVVLGPQKKAAKEPGAARRAETKPKQNVTPSPALLRFDGQLPDIKPSLTPTAAPKAN